MNVSLEEVVTIIGGLILLTTNVVVLFKTLSNNRATSRYHAEITEYHHEVNNKMDRLLKLVRAEGVAEGRQEVKSEQAIKDIK